MATLRPIAVIVQGRSGLRVRLEAPQGNFAGVTNADGYFCFLAIPEAMTKANFFVDDPDSEFYGIVIDLPPGPHQLFVGSGAQTPGFDLTFPALVPKRKPLPHLEFRGIDAVDEHGTRICLNGVDQFSALRHLMDGHDLEPLLRESHELGFQMWRVFLMGSKAQNTIMDLRPSEPGYYEALGRLANLLNQNGIILLATVFVDAQDVMPNRAVRNMHWGQVASVLRGSSTLLSGGNEWSKNGFHPSELSDPGMEWSRGSDTDDKMPFAPEGTFSEFHPRRDLPASHLDTVASPVYIHQSGFKRLLIDEPPRMGTEGSSDYFMQPRSSYEFARHYATECAGAVFHSRAGQKSEPMDGLTRECAEAWQRGMRL